MIKEPDSLIFSGRVIEFDKKLNRKILYVDYSLDDLLNLENIIIIPVKIADNGSFRFKLPNLNKPYKITITMSSIENKMVLGNGKSYYTEPKDNILMEIQIHATNIAIGFKGKGSEKYNLVEHLLFQELKSHAERKANGLNKWNKIRDSSDLNLKMKGMAASFLKLKVQKAILISESRINQNIKIIIDKEFQNYNNHWAEMLLQLYRQNPNLRKQVINIFTEYSDQFVDVAASDNLTALCFRYQISKSFIIAFTLMMSNNTDNVDIKNYYEHVKQNYSGKMRDRLICNMFFFNNMLASLYHSYTAKTLDSLLKDASKIVETTHLKTMIKNKIVVDERLNSTKVIDAQFKDLQGNLFDLKSLRGKTVLIDTWFTGCTGCAANHNDYKMNLYPKFLNNPDFVVLSLNADETKEKWIKGIKSGLYCLENQLHLSTGAYLTHPFLKHYGVVGCPWLMLIDADGIICFENKGPVDAEKMLLKINAAMTRSSREK